MRNQCFGFDTLFVLRAKRELQVGRVGIPIHPFFKSTNANKVTADF